MLFILSELHEVEVIILDRFDERETNEEKNEREKNLNISWLKEAASKQSEHTHKFYRLRQMAINWYLYESHSSKKGE